MRLVEILLEGGNAFKEAGSIHKLEIPATLKQLEKQLGFKNLTNRLLGSAGNKTFSGDLDIAIDLSKTELLDLLKSKMDPSNVRIVGGLIHILVPIVGYNSNLDQEIASQQDRKRTGFIQVDFVLGDVEWNKNYYHANPKSKFPGKYRNLLLVAFLRANRTVTKTQDGEIESGYVWSPTEGLSLREKIKTSDKSKTTTKVVSNEKNFDKIAKTLFGSNASGQDLMSFEKLYNIIQTTNPNISSKVFRLFAEEIEPKHLSLDWPGSIRVHLPQT